MLCTIRTWAGGSANFLLKLFAAYLHVLLLVLLVYTSANAIHKSGQSSCALLCKAVHCGMHTMLFVSGGFLSV